MTRLVCAVPGHGKGHTPEEREKAPVRATALGSRLTGPSFAARHALPLLPGGPLWQARSRSASRARNRKRGKGVADNPPTRDTSSRLLRAP